MGAARSWRPGFVNIHCMSAMTGPPWPLRGCRLQGAHRPLLPDVNVSCARRASGYRRAQLCRVLRSGCTTVMELEEDVEALAPFVEKQLGIRSAMGEMVGDADPTAWCTASSFSMRGECGTARARPWVCRALARPRRRTHHRDPRAQHDDQPVAKSSCRRVRAAADQARAGGATDPSRLEQRSRGYEAAAKRVHGSGPFEFARDNGLPAPTSWRRIATSSARATSTFSRRHDPHVAHCPLECVRGRIAPVHFVGGASTSRWASTTCLATISLMPGGRRDLRADQDGGSRRAVSTDALEMATIGRRARHVAWRREIGSPVSETGQARRPDHARLPRARPRKPVLDPVQNPSITLTRDVELVMVDGNVLVDGGEITTIDRDAVIDAAKLASQAAWGRFEAKYGGPIAAA